MFEFFLHQEQIETPYSIKSLGAYFSVNLPALISNQYLSATPQVVNANNFITDTINWIEIQGCFIAQGGEQYITIGNFNSNANTDTLHAGTVNPLSGAIGYAYYYIDSVTLWQSNFPTFIKEDGKDVILSVYPNPAGGIVNIKLEMLNGKENCHIKISDMLGRETFVSEYKERLDISHLQNGIYFLSLYDEHKKLLGTKKIIK